MTPSAVPAQNPTSGANWYPKLDGLNLPQALVFAVRKAFDTIYSVRALASSPQSLSWSLLLPKNSWTPVAGNWPLSCAIDASGRLALSGSAKVASYVDGSVIAQLPGPSFYPASSPAGPAMVEDTTSNTSAVGFWAIDGKGELTITSQGTTAGHNARVFLDGISARIV